MKTLFPFRSIPLSNLAFLGILSLACGQAGGQSGEGSVREEEGQDVQTLGTLEGTVDGEARTWHVVAGTAQDGPYSSAVWLKLSEGMRVISLGGFDSPTPPVHTFSRGDGNAAGMSLGDYDGSTLNVMLQVPAGGGPTRFSFPEAEAQNVGVVFMPVFDINDMSGMYRLVQGFVEVEAARIQDGTASAQGSFSGTLKTMSGEKTLKISHGRFRVEGIPFQGPAAGR